MIVTYFDHSTVCIWGDAVARNPAWDKVATKASTRAEVPVGHSPRKMPEFAV
jgi:hypothetical protein